MIYLVISVAALLLAENVWKHILVVRFFRRLPPVARRDWCDNLPVTRWPPGG